MGNLANTASDNGGRGNIQSGIVWQKQPVLCQRSGAVCCALVPLVLHYAYVQRVAGDCWRYWIVRLCLAVMSKFPVSPIGCSRASPPACGRVGQSASRHIRSALSHCSPSVCPIRSYPVANPSQTKSLPVLSYTLCIATMLSIYIRPISLRLFSSIFVSIYKVTAKFQNKLNPSLNNC